MKRDLVLVRRILLTAVSAAVSFDYQLNRHCSKTPFAISFP